MVTRLQRCALAWVCLVSSLAVAPGARAERVNSLHAELQFARGGLARVTETWEYDFEGANRHFVDRELARTQVIDGRTLETGVRVRSVEDANGGAIPYSISRSPDELRLRIGDPATRLRDRVRVQIVYELANVVGPRDGGQEIVVDLTGPGWRVPVDAVSARVGLPNGAEVLRTGCALVTATDHAAGCHATSGAAPVVFVSDRPLAPGERMQIAVAVPRGTIAPLPGAVRGARRVIASFGHWGLLPIACLLVLALFAFGRRDEVASTDGHTPPERLGPAEVAAVFHARVDEHAFAATALDLARRGHLELVNIGSRDLWGLTGGEWIVRKRAGDDALRSYEVAAIEALVGDDGEGRLSELRDELPGRLRRFRRLVLRELRGRGRTFLSDPETISRRLTSLIGLCVVVALVGWALASRGLTLSLLTTAGVLALGTRFVPIRTRLGSRVRGEIEAFRQFVSGASVDSLQVDELFRIDVFEGLLPYAYVVGAADEWADVFALGYLDDPPRWLEAGNRDTLAALGEFMRRLASTAEGERSDEVDGEVRFRGRYAGGHLA